MSNPGTMVLQAMASDDESTIEVACRYCKAPVPMLGSFIGALKSWNAQNPKQPAICKSDVMVCTGCHPRWETETVGRANRQTQQVAAYCGDVRRGTPVRPAAWMTKNAWAMKIIGEARMHRAKSTAGGDELS